MVALRKESVDRNRLISNVRPPLGVALRKESVDRNGKIVVPAPAVMMSLSARRAWIEITFVASITMYVSWSLSARRAWIEIPTKSQNLPNR